MNNNNNGFAEERQYLSIERGMEEEIGEEEKEQQRLFIENEVREAIKKRELEIKVLERMLQGPMTDDDLNYFLNEII